MELNDSRIKGIIINYQQENKLEYIDELRKEIDLYIYHFPKLAYRQSLDFCSEFYLYVIDRIESIIKNFPIEEDIKFKTWFNYVLKNQYINFCIYQKNNTNYEVNLEDYSEIIPLESLDLTEENINNTIIKQALSNLDKINQLFIKLYYFPENLNEEDIIFASKYFQLSIKDILNIQGNLIKVYHNEIEKIRKISEKLNIINKKLVDLKYELMKLKKENNVYNDEYFEKNNTYLKKITKLENSKNKLIRYLEMPDRNAFLEFSRFFRNTIIARTKLQEAKKRLKFEVFRIMNFMNEKKGDN